MRRQDELVHLYPASRPMEKKFILTQVAELGLSHDAEDLLHLLQDGTKDADRRVRNQAVLGLTGFLPGFVRKKFALASTSQSPWTAYSSDLTALDDRAAPNEGARREASARAAAFSARLEATVSGWLGTSKDLPPDDARRLLVALSMFPMAGWHDRLKEHLRNEEARFESVLPLALSARTPAEQERILRRLRSGCPQDPDLCLLVPALPGKAAAQFIAESLDQVGELGRINLASSLPLLHDVDHQALIPLFENSREDMVKIQTLSAIEHLGILERASSLAAAYATRPADPVREQIIRTADGLRTDETQALCVQAIADPSGEIQAVALESLVRLRIPKATLLDAAACLRASPSVRARSFALLILGEVGGEEVLDEICTFLFSTDAHDRLEGAFCLGYIRKGRALEFLETMVSHETNAIVRLQAVKSLARYPLDTSKRILLEQFQQSSGPLLDSVGSVLRSFSGPDAEDLGRTLIPMLPRMSGEHRVMMCRILGSLAARSELPEVPSLLISQLEGASVDLAQGALGGLDLLGGGSEPDVMAAIERHSHSGDPTTRILAAGSLLLRGSLDALEIWSSLLATAGRAGLQTLVVTLSDLSVLVQDEGLGWRFPALDAALAAEGRIQAASAAGALHGDALRDSLDHRSRALRSNPAPFDVPIVVSRRKAVTPVPGVPDQQRPRPAPSPSANTNALRHHLEQQQGTKASGEAALVRKMHRSRRGASSRHEIRMLAQIFGFGLLAVIALIIFWVATTE